MIGAFFTFVFSICDFPQIWKIKYKMKKIQIYCTWFNFKSLVSQNRQTIKLLLFKIVKAIYTKRLWQTPTKYHESSTAKIHEEVSHRKVCPETNKNF